MEWQLRLTPVEEPRCGVVGAPQPHLGLPYSPMRWPTLCFGPFSASWSLGRPLHPPPLPIPSFYFSNWE